MRIVFSINGVPIRLTEERWKFHIILRHPELEDYLEDVLITVSQLNIVQQGDVGTILAIRKFQDKYLVVIYKEVSQEDGFILTAYFTERLRRRPILWKC